MLHYVKQLFYLSQWFLRARFFGRRAPLQTVLFITDKCNLRCKHCSVYGSAGYKQRSFEDIVADMRYSYELGSRFIDLEGGEPTLWKEEDRTINDLIDKALEIGFFSITVTTNAQQDFSWIHPQSIWVSMDGVGEYHDRIRGEGSFARLEENIRKSGKKQFLTYYFIAAHPGCTESDMRELKRFAEKELNLRPEQVQIFTPTPLTAATCMYYTGIDPYTGRNVHVARGLGEKQRQKDVLTGGTRQHKPFR